MISSSKDEEPKVKQPKSPIDALNQKDSENINILRPRRIIDYIGQKKVVEQLNIILNSAKKREMLPDHILFYGPPGLGKTTLSLLVASELEIDMKSVSAPALKKVGDVVSLLINIDKPTILFIDEIHRLRTEIEETLYSAMEDRMVDIMIGKGQGVSTVRMDLQPFVLVGATTQLGKLSKPLRDRFTSIFKLELYDAKDMEVLIKGNAEKLNINIDSDAISLICTRSRGTPRIANNILKRLLDYQVVSSSNHLTKDEVELFLNGMGILEDGFTPTDFEYMKALDAGDVSLRTLSGVLLEETDTIEQVIEQHLVHKGMIKKSSAGRSLTLKGREYLQLKKLANQKENIIL
jgi:holliday junction DNA helicase RuvB